MGQDESQRLLKEFEAEAFAAARSLAALGSERLLAEAELPFSLGDYGLGPKLASVIGTMGEAEGTRSLWCWYPAACAFYLIDAGRRCYDHGSLYPQIGEELGLQYRYVNDWAHRLHEFLNRVGLWHFRHGDVSKLYLETILLHGGMPDDAWRQLWQNLVLPHVEGGAGATDAEGLVAFALTNAWTAPQLRITTQHILGRGGEMVLRLIGNALNASRLVLRTGFVDTSVDYGLPPAALAALEEVLHAPRLRWPDVVFDDSRPDPVRMLLPEQRIPYMAHRQRLEVSCDVYASVDGGELMARDDVPAVRRGGDLVLTGSPLPLKPALGYDAVIRFSGIDMSGEPREKRIQWRTAPAAGVWVFAKDRTGRWLCSSTGAHQRAYREATYLVPAGFKLACSEKARLASVIPMGGDWGGWSANTVEAPEGGTIWLKNPDNVVIAEWTLGQTCSIGLENENELAVGALIDEQMPPRVYGQRLPRVVVVPVDPTAPLDPGAWSCRIEWDRKRSSGPQSVDIPLELANRGFALVGDPNKVADQLAEIMADGLYCVDGPRRAGSVRRPFARVPVARPEPIDVKGDDVISGLRATYVVRSLVELAKGCWFLPEKKVTVTRRARGEYLVEAPLSLDRVTVKVGEGAAGVPLNLYLLGVVVQTQDVPRELMRVDCVPMAVVQRNAAGFLRIHASPQSGAKVRLVANLSGGSQSILRCVGAAGRYTETLSLQEFAAAVGDAQAGTLELTIGVGDIEFKQELIAVVPGLGLGRIDLRRERDRLVVRAEHPALMPVSLAARDLTRRWRASLHGEILPGKSNAVLEPPHFSMCVGQYGLWGSVRDEWSLDTDDGCSGEPIMIKTVTQADDHDEPGPMGPFVQGLTNLLLHAQQLGPRPPMDKFKRIPALGMLDADAEATVWSSHSALRTGRAQAAVFGADIMRLRDYRYALCPPVLRALSSGAFSSCASPSEVLAVAAVLRLPMLPLRKNNSGQFEVGELEAAWRILPFVGLLTSQMHGQCGDPRYARELTLAWMESLSPDHDLGTDGLWQLRVCTGTLKNVAEESPQYPATQAHTTLTTRAFRNWFRRSTTKDRLDVSDWISRRLGGCRGSLDTLRTNARGLGRLAEVVAERDVGNHTKTVANLPFVTGALALAVVAAAYSEPASAEAARLIGTDSGLDPTTTGLVQSLLEANAHCHPLLSQDLTLFRMVAEQLTMGDVV